MPKINGKPVDPKVYAKRLTEVKKILARTDPELKRKIVEMYPKISKEQIAKKISPKPKTSRGTTKPAPMPKVTPGGRTAKKPPLPIGPPPKKKSSSTAKPKAQAPKKKTLDDFLLKGKKPPMAPGQKKLPSDADVILKGYNDPATIKKYSKKYKKK